MSASEIGRNIVLFFQNIHPLAAAVLLLPISMLILFGIMQLQLSVCHIIALVCMTPRSFKTIKELLFLLDKPFPISSTSGRSLTRAVR